MPKVKKILRPVKTLPCLLLVALACCSAPPKIKTGQDQELAAGDFAGHVAVGGGRKLYLECRGTGSPTVILESGLRMRGDNWSRADILEPPATPVLSGVAAFARVCTYDRPGTTLGTGDFSRSDPVPMPRSASEVVADLHALLRAAHIPGPYVMAGHSTGGLLNRLYASTYPKEIVGLVLVDALPDGLQPLLTPTQWATFLRLNTDVPQGLETYKDLETIPFEPAFVELRQAEAAQPPRPMPLVVLSRGRPVELPPGTPPDFSEALERAWRTRQDDLVKLVPNARQVVATESEHYIELEQPELVTEAIREVVEAVRRGRSSARADPPAPQSDAPR